MKRKKQVIISCCAAAIVFFLLLLRVQQFGKGETEYNVFLIRYPVQAGTKLNMDMIQQITLKGSSQFENAASKSDTLIGQYLRRDMESGQMLLIRDLYTQGDQNYFSGVTQGRVLYTLSVDADDANGWWLTPGLFVNLFLYDPRFTNPTKAITHENDNSIIMDSPVQIIENIKLLRVMDNTGSCDYQTGKPPSMVCMEMTRDQAMLLFEAENSMKIKIIPGMN
jgi:Flp pilus assembly protein CpaB